jgi:hypothetical protein
MSGFKIWNEACQQWEIIGVGDTLPFNLVEDTTPQLGGNLDTQGNLIIGGTAAGSLLSLKSTTANGTLTAKGVSVLVGNNGATEAITVLNNGNIGIGVVSPVEKLETIGNIRLNPVSTFGYSAITAAINATAGNVNGVNYEYTVTFVTDTGETEPVCGSNTVSPTNQKVDLSTIPVSTDSKVTKRRIYRQVSGIDAIYKKLVGEIDNNIDTTFLDNIADGSLGVALPRVNNTGGQLYINSLRVGFACSGSTAFGMQAMTLNTGYACTAIGFEALKVNTIGSRNTAVGVYSLTSNTTGYSNTAIGVHALNNNISGYGCIAIGVSALHSLTTANNSIAIGNSALQSNNGDTNISIGYQNNFQNTSGINNVSIGHSALWNSLTGHSNVIIGNGAGYAATGSSNIFLGFQSGYSETGNNKLMIDFMARNEADGRAKAIIYGVMDADPVNQRLTINARLIVKQIVAALTDGAPTDTEIDTATGTTPSAAGAGFQCTIKDSSGSGLVYKVESDGTDWYYSAGMTKAVNP